MTFCSIAGKSVSWSIQRCPIVLKQLYIICRYSDVKGRLDWSGGSRHLLWQTRDIGYNEPLTEEESLWWNGKFSMLDTNLNAHHSLVPSDVVYNGVHVGVHVGVQCPELRTLPCCVSSASRAGWVPRNSLASRVPSKTLLSLSLSLLRSVALHQQLGWPGSAVVCSRSHFSHDDLDWW